MPEQPEPLSLMRELRRFGLSYWDGGLYSQPHILILEFHICIDAENIFRAEQLANELLLEKHAAKNANKQPS